MKRCRKTMLAAAVGSVLMASPPWKKVVRPSPAQATVDEAHKLFTAGDYQAAATTYRAAVAKDPGHVGAWRDLGWCLHHLGQNGEAISIWNNLLKVNPGDCATLNALGGVHFSRSEFAQAATCYRRSLQSDPSQPSIPVRLGDALEGGGDWQGASRQFEAALKANPDSAELLLRCARIDEHLGGESLAIRRLETALRRRPALRSALAPRLARLHGSIGDEAFRANDYEKARNAFTSGLEWESENTHLLISLGWTLRKLGDLPGATTCWKKAAANPAAKSVNLLRALGEAHLEMGDLAEARRLLEQARALAPAEPSPCYQLGEIGFLQKDSTLPEASIGALIALPGLEDAWADRAAELFVRHGCIDRGLALFTQAPADNRLRNRALSRLHATLAATALHADRVDEAIDLGAQSLREDPRNRAMLRDLGWMYARKGDWVKARDTWGSYASLYPELPESHSLFAEALLNNQDFKGAKIELDRALALDPQSRPTRLRLLRTYTKSGMVGEAKSLAEKLSAEFPTDLAVQYRYAELLTRSLDHAKAKLVWQRIRDQEPGKLRPALNWLREAYAAEDYDTALAEAARMAEKRPAPESVLLFLTQDAQIQEDHERVIACFRRLTEDCPTRKDHWIGLIRELIAQGRHQEALDVTEKGLRILSAPIELQILRSEAMLSLGRSREALAGFRALTRENAGNAAVFNGMVDSLMGTRHYQEAIERLESNRFDAFSSEFDTLLRKTGSFAGSGRFASARDMLERIVHPKDGSRYVPILLYHGIQNQRRSFGIPADVFEKQISALVKAGYTTLTLGEMQRMIEGRMPWPARPVLITFDDARTDSFLEADTILARLGAKATMFVPTGDSTAEADQFHASWATIRRMAASGRWDIQGHGFEAHQPVTVDAEGNTGRFLNERAWLEEFGRLETDQEFRGRVDQDYRLCREMILAAVPGAEPSAYAFPYSEAGQIAVGSMNTAAAINAETWPKHFRFGMVQDSRGYNQIKPGETGSRLLWRYEPGRGATGEELLQKMARSHPQNAARLQLALLHLWQGYHERANAELKALEKEVPALGPECQLALAEVAWAEARPRKSAAFLEVARTGQTDRQREFAPRLTRSLAWANDPLLSLGGEVWEGSDDRSIRRGGISLRVPFRAPVDVELKLDALRLGEKGQADIQGQSAEGRLAWAPTTRFDTTAWARYTQYDDLPKRKSAGISFHYSLDLSEFRLGAAREGLDTVSAVRAQLGRWTYDAEYRFRFANWSLRAGANVDDISDQNRVASGSAKLLYQFRGHSDWRVGLAAERADSRVHSLLYYTPMGFSAVLACGEYSHNFQGGSSLLLDASFGHCRDAINRDRWTGTANLAWVQMLTEHLRLDMDLGAGSSQGYSFRRAGLKVQWRF